MSASSRSLLEQVNGMFVFSMLKNEALIAFKLTYLSMLELNWIWDNIRQLPRFSLNMALLQMRSSLNFIKL